MAEKLGATHTFAAMAEATDFVRSITDGQGADAAILTMGLPTNADVADAFAAIGKGGTVVVTGMAVDHRAGRHPGHLLELGRHAKDASRARFSACATRRPTSCARSTSTAPAS